MTFARPKRLATGALPAFAMLVALVGCGGSHARFHSHIERGQRYLAAGNLEKAGIEFRNALQIEPTNSDAFYFNGRVAERRGNVREAIQYYQAALDARPTDNRSRASLAKVFVLGGAAAHAMEIVAPGLLDNPREPDLLAARAAARHELGDDTEARRDAEYAVKVAPTNDNAISVLAALALRAGDNARAVTIVSDAIAKKPDSVDLRRIMTSVYLDVGQPREAEEQMRKIIALEPTEMAPRLQLANHFVQSREIVQAQRVLEDAVRDLPQRVGAKLALVDFVATQRSPRDGEVIMRRFIAREPDDDDLRLGLGTLLQREGAVPEAVATYREVIRRDGLGAKGLAARDRIAAIETTAGRFTEASKLLEEVLAESPRDDDALIMRATIALEQNDPTSAIADFRVALRNQPRSMVLQRSLARAYLMKGQPALAEEALRAAMDAAPNDDSLRIDLARVLIQAERPAPAVTLLEQTIAKAPGNAQARQELVRAYIANHELFAARAAAEDLTKLRPNDAQVHYVAGLIAHDERRYDDSNRELERALQLEPGSLEILRSLTRFDLERGRGTEAIARLRQAAEREPGSPRVLELLGATYLETKDLAHATQVLGRAIELAPRSWVAYRDLAETRLAAADTDGALRNYQAALQWGPTQPGVVTGLAALYEQRGRVDDAIAVYEVMYKSKSVEEQQIAANNLAMLLVTYRSDQPSLDRARTLTAPFDASTNGSFLDTAGWVRCKRREYRDAVALLARASDHSPDSRVIRYHLGMAQLGLGQKADARHNLELALAGPGDFSGSREARAVLATLKASRQG